MTIAIRFKRFIVYPYTGILNTAANAMNMLSNFSVTS